MKLDDSFFCLPLNGYAILYDIKDPTKDREMFREPFSSIKEKKETDEIIEEFKKNLILLPDDETSKNKNNTKLNDYSFWRAKVLPGSNNQHINERMVAVQNGLIQTIVVNGKTIRFINEKQIPLVFMKEMS